MLLLCLKVHSFTLAVFTRAVNMNRSPCSAMGTWRGKKRSTRLLHHVFKTTLQPLFFIIWPPNLWLANNDILTSQKANELGCCFLSEMGSKLYARRHFVLFWSNLQWWWIQRKSLLCWTEIEIISFHLQQSPSCSTESEMDKQADQEVCKILFKWNLRKLPGSAMKGGPVEKKSKIESASVSAKEDVNGQY